MLQQYGNAAFLSAQFVGGEYAHRDHKGDTNARDPFVPVAHVNALAEEMLVGLPVDAVGDGLGRQHHVDLVGRERGEEGLKAAAPADEAQARDGGEGRAEEALGDERGEVVDDARLEPDVAPRGLLAHDDLHLGAEAEDVVGEPERDGPDVGGDEAVPLAQEQLLAERLLEALDLRADGGGREPKLLRRVRDGAGPRDGAHLPVSSVLPRRGLPIH